MKSLQKFDKALKVAAEYGMDGVDLHILAEVVALQSSGEEATIMQFSDGRPYASFGTIHARIKRMVKNGILTKRVKEDNQRYKLLEDGPKLLELAEKLYKVF
jgi:DNA-binding HxlR family transcriptional regulator